MRDKKTLSRKSSFVSRQTQHEAEVNFVMIETNIFVTEVKKIKKTMLQHRHSCYDRIKN